MTIVQKLASDLHPESFDITSFRPPRKGQPFVFELNVTAKNLGGMKKVAQVQPNAPSWSNFEIYCDEGKAIGGSDAAPSPLSYFTSGIAFCLLTHLEEFIHARKLHVDNLKLELKMGFSTLLAVDPAAEDQHGSSTGIEINVIVDSSEPPEVLESLLELTRSSCIALQSIVKVVPDNMQLIHNPSPASP